MADVVLRVSAPDFDVDGFLERHPELEPAAIWYEDEPDFRGHPRDTSGFNLDIVSDESKPVVIAALRAACIRLEPVLRELRERAAALQIDVGVNVTVSHPAVFFGLEPEDLALLARLGLSFWVSAFATSEDEDDHS